MPVFDFIFPGAAAGRPYVVVDMNGDQVASGTLANPAASSGQVELQLTLTDGPDASYVATAGHTAMGERFEAHHVVDEVASFSALSGVAADETAFFVATGPTATTDGDAEATVLVLVADSRHGELPAWASVVDGHVVLGDDAGTCAYSVAGAADLDFSGTTAPTSDGVIFFGAAPVLDGVVKNGSGSGFVAADGEDLQTTPTARFGSVITATTVGLQFTAQAYSDAEGTTTIPDGVASPRVALTITRIAQAAVLPE